MAVRRGGGELKQKQTRSATLDVPHRGVWARICNGCELWYFRYSVTVGIYMLDRWERYMFNAIAISLCGALVRIAMLRLMAL